MASISMRRIIQFRPDISVGCDAMGTSASIYFFAGDFADVLRRHDVGAEQIYATHNEVAKLTKGLLAAGIEFTIYSYVTPEARDERPLEGLRIVSLGARSFDDYGPLRSAVERDRSDAIVAHFPSIPLLRGVMAKNSRALAVLANSYKAKGLKAFLERRQIARLLNSPRFELVSNHCLPATNQLAKMGVARERLIPWNVPLRYDPADRDPKTLVPARRYTAAYAGGIRANKGVADLIRAAAALKRRGLELHCYFAGAGEIEQMGSLGRQLGVADQLTFMGLMPNAEVFDIVPTLLKSMNLPFPYEFDGRVLTELLVGDRQPELVALNGAEENVTRRKLKKLLEL